MTASITTSQTTLSALTKEDSEFLRKLAGLAADGGGPSDDAQLLANAPHQGGAGEALRIAAFLGAFDPLRLIPQASESDLKGLLTDCTVSTDGATSRWNLRAETRSRLLAEIAASPEGLVQGVQEAKRYLERSGEQADEVTRALLEILGGKALRQVDFAAMSKEVLAANRAVLGWLQPVDQKLGFDVGTLLTDIESAELLEPFRFLTGFEPETGGDLFVGRSQELRRLRSFIDVLASEGLLESAQRGTRRLVFKEQDMLLFSGVGGVGKSTLLAKFILQHVLTSKNAGLLFAYLDFDRSTISSSQPGTLLLEMLRQLGWQLPGARSDLEELRDRIRQVMMELTKQQTGEADLERVSRRASQRNQADIEGGSRRPSRGEGPGDFAGSGDQGLPPELIGPSLLSNYLYEANLILAHRLGGAVPVLLVLDTFEEAQALGDQAVTRIETFIEMAREHVQGLKVVFSGRDEVTGFFPDAERMVISEFSDAASRIAFLEKRGLTKQSAASIARQVGGRPLTLLLAARLAREEGLESISVSLTDRFRGLFNKYLLDGILYQRILSHINDPDVRTLAHPGLVLRRIDPEVLKQVVAPVLGLGEFTDERVWLVMTALRHQKDLVRVEPDGSVTHRADVREQMLVLMGAEKPELVRELHAAAASYYAARQVAGSNIETRDRDRTEEIYHRLSIGDSLERMPQLWTSKVRLGLARSVDEIADIAGRGTLKVLLGRDPAADELKLLPSDILREYATKALRSAIAAQNPERAQELMEVYAGLLAAELRRTLEPQIFDLAGQWQRAGSLFSALLNEVERGPAPSDALAAADFFERCPGGDRQRAAMADLLRGLGARLQSDSGLGVKVSPLWVATLRLKVRQGVYGRNRVALEDADLAGSESLLPISGSPGASQQWMLTLTDAIDRQGPRALESMPVTDSVRGQLAYLKSMLMHGKTTQSDAAAVLSKVCDVVGDSETVGFKTQQLWVDVANRSAVALVLRHLVRPATPQWYVPLACLLRKEMGGALRPSDVYEKSLPELPFRASATLRTTKALADFLGQLDQLGVLHICLQRLLARRQGNLEPSVGEIADAYLQWRQAMFFDLDDWFGSFDRIRPLLEAPREMLR